MRRPTASYGIPQCGLRVVTPYPFDAMSQPGAVLLTQGKVSRGACPGQTEEDGAQPVRQRTMKDRP